ncbi:MAG TPA: hypothetical protein ENK91_15465, partial [Bacteroidetes bacterium]|nr:hypothetical protein [Bacteroidota bacterium]
MKYISWLLIFIFLVFLTSSVFGQINIDNTKGLDRSNYYLPSPKYPELFKTIPLISDDSPEWVKLLYSPEPNYYKISDAFENYYKSHPFLKNTNTQNFKYFGRIID